jgi:sec-independent protein translocase protein TatC
MRKFFRGVWKIVTAPFRALRWLVKLPYRAIQFAHHFLTVEPEAGARAETLLATLQEKGARQDIWNHIEALRKHLFRSLLALILATIVGWFFTDPVLTLLAAPVGGPQNLQVIDLTESIGVFMKVAVMLGLGISIPYIAFEFWLFAAPGLRPRERRTSLIGLPLTALLFYLGVLFTYRFMLPPAIDFLIHFGEFTSNPTAEKYYNLITRLLIWIGLFFEFPLVIYILTSIGFVKPKQLARQWRLAIIIIGVIAAVITPTTDMGSMALVMAPMIILYFISIGLSFAAYAARKRRAETQPS